MKLYAQGLARRLHEQRVGMTDDQMMHPRPADGASGSAEPPNPPRVLQDATNCYNSADVHGRNGKGNRSKYDKTSDVKREGAMTTARQPRLLENRIDGSGEDVEPIDAKLAFERRIAQKVKPLSVAEENAIDLIVLGHSDQSVANHCGVHRVTVTRWRLYNPAFRAELSRRRQEIAGATADGFRQLAANALVAMSKLLEDPNPSLRFRAARSILAMAPRFAPPDEPIDVEGVLTAEGRKLNVQFNEIHPARAIVYEDERERALNHLMQRAGEDYTVDDPPEESDAPADTAPQPLQSPRTPQASLENPQSDAGGSTDDEEDDDPKSTTGHMLHRLPDPSTDRRAATCECGDGESERSGGSNQHGSS